MNAMHTVDLKSRATAMIDVNVWVALEIFCMLHCMRKRQSVSLRNFVPQSSQSSCITCWYLVYSASMHLLKENVAMKIWNGIPTK